MTGTVKGEGTIVGLPDFDINKDWEREGAKSLNIKSSFNDSEVTKEEILQANLIKR